MFNVCIKTNRGENQKINEGNCCFWCCCCYFFWLTFNQLLFWRLCQALVGHLMKNWFGIWYEKFYRPDALPITHVTVTKKDKSDHAPQESVGGCSSPSFRPGARRWRTQNANVWHSGTGYWWLQCMASTTPDLWLLSQPQCWEGRRCTDHWLVPNYTAWWQRHTC